jgi:GH15 family glucan-1,4-alpha-glucosidase
VTAASTRERAAPVERRDGYLPIGDYAAIGDGRTVALVGRDGSIDWLCLPDVDSPSVFGRLLDAEGGGFFAVSPAEPFAVERRYQPRSNVLETTFHASSGSARVTDAMTLADGGLPPLREVVRRVEGLSGRLRLRWSFEPRFGYSAYRSRVERRGRLVVAGARADQLALGIWGAGEPKVAAAGAAATFDVAAGDQALLAMTAAHAEPSTYPRRDDCERRLARVEGYWPRWSGERLDYDGPWADQVTRSALALRLLMYAPSGAIVAAATTSLPESLGGERNWDYRFAWVRDASYTVAALMRIGCGREGSAFFAWLMHALRLSLPRIGVLYRVTGRPAGAERELGHLPGYRSSAPVRAGNAAAGQLQLDVYGILLDAAWIFVEQGGELDRRTGRDLARIADEAARIWREPDAGIWEVRGRPRHYVHSKGMCWVALDRACRLAERQAIPNRCDAWRRAASEIRAWVDIEGWDGGEQSLVRAADLREPDAALLGLCLTGFADDAPERLEGTIDRVRRDLAEGPFVYRYRGDDRLRGTEGAFVATSFWLVDSLARAGRIDEACARMDAVCREASNDVGLLAEEIDPHSGELLGNFPQALSHLALVNAALSIQDAQKEQSEH